MTPEEAMHNLIGNLWRQYWWFFLLVIFWPLLKMLVPVIKGKIGEGMVNLAAKLRLDPTIYHLINDVTVPSKAGTTQIDHVIVSKFGIFVVETKNYSGWIFADARAPKWTQVHSKQKHGFQNPLRQNYAHICALSDLLGLSKDKIHGVVCFMGEAKFKTAVPEGVFLEGRYVNYIESFQTPVFSENETADLFRRIKSGQLERGFQTNRAHVKQLNARHAAPENNFAQTEKSAGEKRCQKCGSEMVLRTARKGANAGNQFWGCANYPSCRSTAPVSG